MLNILKKTFCALAAFCATFAVFANPVAKVGNTEYATIDEAIANWTNGSTLTLLADVTLSDVIKLNSTEHHLLNLGTFTMTAASKKDAIEIVPCGVGTASKSCLTIDADSQNPGGIVASGKACIYYYNKDKINDRMTVTVNGGTFSGSYAINSLSGSKNFIGVVQSPLRGQGAPYYVFNGGVFNAQVFLNAAMLKVTGGTFHKNLSCYGDTTAYRLISGGRFSGMTMTADAEGKFTIGSAKSSYNVGLYVDKEGYLVVGGPVITELSATYPAVASNYSKWSSYLKYSSAATYGLFYTDKDVAIKKHGADYVTIWEKPAVTIPENVMGEATVVEEIKNNTALKGYTPSNLPTGAELEIELKSVGETIVYDVTPMANGAEVDPTEAITFRLPVPASVTKAYAKVFHEGSLMGIYAIKGEGNAKFVEVSSADFSEFAVEPTETVPVASINGVGFATFAEVLSAASAMTGDVTVEVLEKVTLNGPLTGSYASIKFVGKTENAEIYLDIQGYAEAAGKKVAFEGLKLSKVAGAYIANAGFMNLAFGIYSATEVAYTNCMFVNGAYASSGKNTFINCTFYRSHDRYGLWAYGAKDIVVDGCTFADIRGIKMFDEGKAGTTSITVKNTDFSAADNKPAIVLTYGQSVTLENNTYSSKGVFELDLGGAPNGVTVTSDVAPTCVNDNGACGVLVDGKIYTTVAQAAAVATAGSNVTLLHNSTETVALPMGVTLDKNGFEAAGVSVLQPVAEVNGVKYTSIQAAINAAQAGDTVVVLPGEYGAIDLSNKNITIKGTVGDNDELLTTIKGGNPAIIGHGFNGTIKDIKIVDAFKVMYAEPAGNVTVDNVYVTGATYGFHLVAYTQGLTWTIQNSYMDLSWANSFGVHDNGDAAIVITGNTFASTNPYYPDYGALAVNTFLPNVTVEGNVFGEKTKIYIDHSVSDTSSVKVSKNYHADGVDNAFADDADCVKVGIYEYYSDAKLQNLVVRAAKIGNTYYASLEAAAAAAQAGDEIVLLLDATISAKLTLPSGITFNGNGKSITGAEVWADGNLAFVGHTKMQMFNAGYNTPTITIGEGACLELTGTGRMVIGHGATFNITGNIADAKTANVAEITPSLITAGASFTGAGVNFNVNNAYVKFTAYCSSKNSNASGTFNINVTNSIWEQINTLVFTEPTNGKDPTFNFNVVNSVLNSTSHLVFGVTKGEIVFDNSNVNVGANRQLENRSTLTIKNGSVVYAAHATSSNAKNPGTTIVENATLVATGEFSGSDVGTGTLIVKKGANVTMGKITKANIQIDATDMTEGELANFTANLSGLSGTLTVVNNDSLEASIVDGKIVLAKKPVAEVNGVKYTDLQEAINAANGGTVKLISDILYTTVYANNKTHWNGDLNYELSVGGNVTLDLNGYTITSKGGSSHSYYALICVRSGSLTVVDGSEAKTGAIVTDASAIGSKVYTIYNNGSLTVSGGTISNYASGGYAIESVTVTNTALTINEGANITSVSIAVRVCSQGSSGTQTVRINGGTINGTYAMWVPVKNSGRDIIDMEINGGTFTGSSNAILFNTYTSADYSTDSIAIKGGVFSGAVLIGSQYATDANNTALSTALAGKVVSGGTFSNDVSDYVAGGYMLVQNEGGTYGIAVDPAYGKVAKIGETYYETLQAAVNAAQEGDTVTLLGDCKLENSVNFDTPITVDGAGYKVSASRTTGVSEPMFNVRTTMTVKNITLDACHKFTYCIEAMGENCDLTVTDVTLLYPGKINDSLIGQLGGGISVNNGKLKVSGSFTAFSGGESDGSFPFTGILIWDQVANVRFEDGATASIADPTGKTNESDLLLIGAPVMLDVETANLMLSQFKIPGQFVPYTLAVGSWGFTGASPLPWNKIIYYGKEILKVIGENPNEIPAQVGLLQDTEIPEVFIFEDANFSINGNGKKLTGTIDFTDSVGTIENVELTSETKLVMTNVTEGCVKLGEDVIITSPVKVIPPDNFGRGEDSATLIEFAEGSELSLKNFEIDTSTVQLPEGSQIVQDGNKIIVKLPIAKIGDTYYASLEAAAAAAQAGDEIVLLLDATLSAELTLPAGIKLNGNGKQINGTIYAGGDLTFTGHTKVTAFSASYYNRTITIGEGACLEITGTGRVTLGYGNVFNITGSIENAKTADKAQISPSLIIPGGISITGGNDATMNVLNAYVKIGSTSSKNNAANGTFTLNFTNSIAEFTNQLTFAEPTSGKDPTFVVNVKDSVLTTATKLCIAAPKSTVKIDNSVVTLATYLRNSGTLSLEDGSVLTGAMIQFGENGGNDGAIIVDASALTIKTGAVGHAMDGNGTGYITLKNGATANIDYIQESRISVDSTSAFAGINDSAANLLSDITVEVDAAGMAAGVVSALNVNPSASTVVTVVNNDSLEASIVDGKIVLSAKPVAKIGDETYQTLQDAIAAVQVGETITLIGNIDYVNVASAADSTTSINVPAGKKFTLDLNGYTISGENDANKSFAFMTICVGADVTIDDTSAGKTGKITYKSTRTEANENHEGYTIRNQGNLTLNGGKIENATELASNGKEKCVTVAVNNGTSSSGKAATFTMNGGEVVSDTYFAIRSNVYANNTVDADAVVVALNGGTVYGLHFCDWGTANLNYQVAVGENAVVECGKYPDYLGQSLRLVNAAKETTVVSVEIAENAQVKGDIYSAGTRAKIGNKCYTKLAAAIAALKDGDTLVILSYMITDGAIKLPATLNNVTIKGSEGTVLKDMTISAADGNSYSYKGLTFDGITFDNSRLLFTGWRNGDEVIENFAVVNCEFKNLDDTTNTAPVHFNKDGSEPVKNFTFRNNKIDGATGGSKSGIYLQATGDVIVENNVINNVSFRPYVIQITTDDGIADNFVVSGNTFSGSSVGRAQGLGNNAAGTDNVGLTVTNNIFKGITDAQQICYWNFNAETTTADLSKNYYDIDIVANPSKIYYNSAAADTVDLIEKGVYPYYTELNADGTINVDSLVQAPAIVAQIGNKKFISLQDAFNAAQAGDTVTVLADISDVTVEVAKNITISGSVALNNVGINAVGATEMTVRGLNFTGNSWINAGTATKLTVSGVTANVTPSNTAYTNSRSAFISLGRSEQHNLELVVENCNIVSNGGSDPILGWAAITKATITGSTFGSESAYQSNSDSIKFMAIADAAEFYISGNKFYSNYNGIVFAQNTTRDNAYVAVIENNEFFGGADHIWIEISGSSSVCHGAINVASNNTVNGNPMVAGDIKAHTGVIKSWTSYAGIDVATDESGKVIGGVLAFYGADAIADGYEVASNGVVQKKPVAKVGESYYYDFESALAAACADSEASRIEILADCLQTSVANTSSYNDIKKELSIGAPKGESYVVTVKPSADSIALRVMEGGKLTIEENVTLNHMDVVANGFYTRGENMVINGVLHAISLKQWTSDGSIYVGKTGKVVLGYGDGQFDMNYGNGSVSIEGNGDKSVPQFIAGYSSTQGSANGNTLNLKNTHFEGGAWFNIGGKNGTFNVVNSILKVSGGDFVGSMTIGSSGNTINLVNSSVLDVAKLTLGAGNTIALDATSSINSTTITGSGKIVIDARTVADTEKQVIFADMSGFNGTITVEGGTYEKLNNGVVIKREVANAYFDGYYYNKFEDAFADAMDSDMSKVSISVLGDSTVGTMEIPAGKSIVLDLGGKMLTKAAGAKIVVDNAIVKFANGTLDGFSASDVEIKGDSVATFPADTVELSAFADTFYKTTNEDGSVSVATKFRSFIQVESGVPCIGFLKNATSEYKVYGKAELTDADWTLVEMDVEEGVVSDNPALPLKWHAPVAGEYRFFKVEMIEAN